MARLLTVLLLALLVYDSKSENSIRARANLPVFQFFSRSGHHILDEEIPKIEIPIVTIPIDAGPGTGQVTAKNMKIVKFVSPKFDFELLKEGLSWTSHGGAIKIEGDWNAEYKVLVPISQSGYMKAFLSDIKVSLTAAVYPLDGRPQLKIGKCNADIDQLDIEIGGGFLPWLVNLFRTPISAAIRDQIHKQACTSAKEILLLQANDFLHDLPLHIPIGANFYVDYIFSQKPRITSQYVEGDASADIVYGNVSCIPKRTGNWTEAGDRPGMVTVWLSQSIPNCLLSSAHQGGLVQFTVTKDTPNVGTYLQTSCPLLSICVGKFFSKLRQDYPNRYIDLQFHTYETPFLNLQSGTAHVNTTFAVDIQLNPRKDNPDVLARLVLSTSSSVIPYIERSRLMANINQTTVTVREEFSKIGDVSPTFLKFFQTVFSKLATLSLEAVLHTGIPLPIIDNITIANSSEISIFNEFVRLNVDFEYE